jgi:hypothetical protein
MLMLEEQQLLVANKTYMSCTHLMGVKHAICRREPPKEAFFYRCLL